MENINKKEYFEAFISELLNWHKEVTNSDNNDLSKLKVLKLLFLGVSKNEKYLDIFDDFRAWEYGPVEKDVYRWLTNDNLNYFKVGTRKTEIKSVGTYSEDAVEFGKSVIKNLKEKNKNLILLSASSLVEITHKWNCWISSKIYDSEFISKEQIYSDIGYFS